MGHMSKVSKEGQNTHSVHIIFDIFDIEVCMNYNVDSNTKSLNYMKLWIKYCKLFAIQQNLK